jgi:hypothetical protein
MLFRLTAFSRLCLAPAVLAAGFAGTPALAAHAKHERKAQAPAATPAPPGPPRPVLVELYTSQGCSSCVPADALMGQLADRRDVIALSLPITYWDMLGWKDTLATNANTNRQKAYAEAMGRGGVYTPQMIVDGVNDLVGSRDQAIQAAITAREGDMEAVPVNVSTSDKEVHIEVGAGQGDDATIWLFRVLPRATVTITAGENSGHTITYRNVVQDVKAVGLWKGQPVTLDLPRQEIGGAARDEIAVVVQKNGYGRVIGAAIVTKPAL